MPQTSQAKDHWTQQAYSSSAPFVPQLTTKVLQWLDANPNDVILDLGCGDGSLTAKIKSQCARVDGFDASANLIRAAKKDYGNIEGLTWHIQDCRYLEVDTALKDAEYDKVFSNAALHWILREPTTRMSVFKAAHRALKSGGTLVFEMGGAGNVAGVHTALLAALVHQGVSVEKARDACPWFFPSETLMADMLTEAGFAVEKSELDYRPTKLQEGKEGGLEGWVRLMGAQFLEVLKLEEQREAMVREICDVLKTVLTHEEDGTVWLGYLRLRVKATRK